MELAHTAPWIAALLTGLIVVSHECAATTWTVGNASGWALDVNYSQWVEGKNFQPGDVFFFSYDKAKHNVLEVSEADQSTCTTADPIASFTDGSTRIPLGNVSTHYYICGIPGHCLDGMTLVIEVTNGSSPAPTPSPAPSASVAPSISSPSPSPSSSPGASSVPSPASTSTGTGSPPSMAPGPSAAASQSPGALMALAAIFLSCRVFFKG